jgi:hypothetical protein
MPNAGGWDKYFTTPSNVGKTPLGIEAFSLSDDEINKMLHDGTFTEYINKVQQAQQDTAYDFNKKMTQEMYI